MIHAAQLVCAFAGGFVTAMLLMVGVAWRKLREFRGMMRTRPLLAVRPDRGMDATGPWPGFQVTTSTGTGQSHPSEP